MCTDTVSSQIIETSLAMDYADLDLGVALEIIRRPRRRRLSLQVDRYGKARVLVPNGVSQSEIRFFIQAHRDWLLQKVKQQTEALMDCQLRSGTQIYYLGQAYSLKLSVSEMNSVGIENSYLHCRLPKLYPSALRQSLIDWLRTRAEDILPERVAIASQAMQLSPKKLRIKSMKSRWGSCSSQGHISLSWNLVMASLPALDYVCIHELAHLKHMNHGPQFWELVAEYCPEYQVHKRWLRQHQTALQCLLIDTVDTDGKTG